MGMNVIPTSKVAIVAEQIVTALATAWPESLSTSDLIRIAEPESDNDVHRALAKLRNAGEIGITGTTTGPRGSTVRMYRLAPAEALAPPEAERLIEVLERDLPPLPATPESIAFVDAWSGSEHADGDEFARAACCGHCAEGDLADHQGKSATAFDLHRWDDPLIRAILAAPDPEPKILEAPMYAATLSALIARLDSGRPVMPNVDLVARLDDLRALIEELAA